MEVAVGYKRTLVGILPEDWEVRRFADHFTIYAGGDVPKHSLSQTKSDAHPFPIFANALQNSGLYGYTGELRASADSLTITARGYLGHAEYRSEPFFPIVRLLVLEPTGKLDARFTAYAVNELVDFAIESTGVPQLTAPQVGKYAVGAPPTLAEQKAIAAALSDVDALLGALDRLIAKKRDLKQAAMQQLLTGQNRLPGFRGHWEVSTVGREFDIQLGKMLDTDKNTGSPKTYLGNKDVQWGRIDITELRTMLIPESELERYRLCPGDLLVCEGGEVGRAAIWEAPLAECYYQKALHRLRPSKALNPRFMLALLRHWTAHNHLRDYVSQTSIAHLTREKFAQVPLLVPTTEEQAAIVAVLSDFDAEMEALEQRRSKTQLLKQGMMQELLTGRTRLV
ncbi:MAG: restriction endonuclease subunit S [Deltaproteobacteria bacterium]|nr:restriction endonuclease subunit S [Kofleriaceae bacterium]